MNPLPTGCLACLEVEPRKTATTLQQERMGTAKGVEATQATMITSDRRSAPQRLLESEPWLRKRANLSYG